MTPAKNAAVALLALACALAIAGCGGGGGSTATTSTTAAAKADICAARDDISAQVDRLRGLTASTATIDGVAESLQSIENDLRTISDNADVLGSSARSQVQDANDRFTSTVDDVISNLGTSVSLASARQQLTTAFRGLQAGYGSSLDSLGCS